ncbi:MAG: hypothetical protein GF411_14795 [Candidatus Lokiarchaeota archaeon]|nr:hypothetical protein [Candidatus Lokiarchaeota archaeon]
MDVVARLSGIVAYSDGSHQSFAVMMDDEGRISYNDNTESNDAIAQAQDDTTWLQDMMNLLVYNIPYLFGEKGPEDKQVISMSAHFAGRIAYPETGTFEDWSVEFRHPKIGAWTPLSTSPMAWLAASNAKPNELNLSSSSSNSLSSSSSSYSSSSSSSSSSSY